jgi:hypothetical protein
MDFNPQLADMTTPNQNVSAQQFAPHGMPTQQASMYYQARANTAQPVSGQVMPGQPHSQMNTAGAVSIPGVPTPALPGRQPADQLVKQGMLNNTTTPQYGTFAKSPY